MTLDALRFEDGKAVANVLGITGKIWTATDIYSMSRPEVTNPLDRLTVQVNLGWA